jgi:nicotinate-nucleotide--dimethylbenzimidazole phosphoribosyltransferase
VQDTWPRPVPNVGDRTSAAERAEDPEGWAFDPEERAALDRIMSARRDVRRFRPDPIPALLLDRVLSAAHHAPSVGHSQPWRFVLVTDAAARARAAVLADRARLAQAAAMDPESSRHLLDLDLEGIREAPLGIVVCCDRRAPAGGVLGRATFQDADMWSCACAIQNLWLAARAEGLGVGWVTLFQPQDLGDLIAAPEGIATLGWLCVGWPDERPPAPGLERRGWAERIPLERLVIREKWPASDQGPLPPRSRLGAGAGAVERLDSQSEGAPNPLIAPTPEAVVAAHDSGDRLLSAPGSLGVLDRAVDKLLSLGIASPPGQGALVLAAADHPVTAFGVSAYPPAVTRHVAEAALAGRSVGAVAARCASLDVVVVDAGIDGPALPGSRSIRPTDPRGDLVNSDGLSTDDVRRLVAGGQLLGRELARAGCGVIALGEAGVGNTTVAAVLAAALLGVGPAEVVGLGAGSDSSIVRVKEEVVARALDRIGRVPTHGPLGQLAACGGGEFAVLAGVVLGAAAGGAAVILDGMATSVAALVAVESEPAVAAHLIAGQRSRETGHRIVLEALGLEPLLDLRLRAGEGAGAAMAVGLLRSGLQIRLDSARTRLPGDGDDSLV